MPISPSGTVQLNAVSPRFVGSILFGFLKGDLLNRLLFLIFCAVAIFPLGYCEARNVSQKEYTALSPSFEDVSTTVSKANSGDTVIVPAGSATWDNQLVITKGIILKSANFGDAVITSNYNASNPGNPLDEGNFLIVYKPASPSSNEPFRLSGFILELDNKCRGILLKNATMTPVNRIRVDHNTFSNPAGDFLFVIGTVYGVADNNTFNGGVSHFYGLGDSTWNNLTFKLGSADNFYLEDNVFNGSGSKHGGESSGRYCVRHNIYNLTGTAYPLCDVHGNQPGGGCGMMGAEVYDNTINAGSYGMTILDQRGGRVVAYNNNAISTGSVTLKIREEHDDSLNPPQASPDGEPQYPSSSYYWENKRNGNPLMVDNPYVQETVDYRGSLGRIPKENREFWRENPSFDGTKGMGVGPLAFRPVTGTAGVAYWATDTKTLYRYTTNNVWEEFYKPYIYPHPLRSLLSSHEAKLAEF